MVDGTRPELLELILCTGSLRSNNLEPNLELFVDALDILKAIERFWTQIEIDVGTFEDHGDVSVDDVMPGSLLVLQMCIDAYVEGVEANTTNE